MITTVLFDLDGTLLPMDQDAFTRGYFKFLAAKLAPHGYEPKQLVEAIWTGTEAMVRNDGILGQIRFHLWGKGPSR
jgi:phosphoglycolate phosphatase-like HAD superfamily hydrolase